MPDKTKRIGQLIVQELNGSLDDSERQELNEWLALSTDNSNWYEQVKSDKFYLPRRLKEYEEAEMIREGGWNKLQAAKQSKVYSIGRRVAVAAAVVAVFSVGALYWYNRSHKVESAVAPVAQQFGNDVPPGSNKAILTLGNGAQIALNDAGNGALARQGTVNVMKLDSGQITYKVNQGNTVPGTAEILWNTLATPRGGQYKVVLADGTKVWLNAASSLRFPSSFTGKTRQVILTGGEAYFEIASNKNSPFKVALPHPSKTSATLGDESQGTQIEVLGTHFNVMAYANEDQMKTTLVEGSVKVIQGGQQHLLKVGEQAVISSKVNHIEIFKDIELDDQIAWKEGLFRFDNTPLQAIMKQVARWYDVDVVYANDVIQSFNGGVPRSVNVSQLLRFLEAAGNVHFKIEGRKVTVMK